MTLARLRRKRHGRMVGGVASAVAQVVHMDPTPIRVVLVLSAFVSGIGVAAYLLAWLLIPLDGTDRSIASRALSDRRGIALVIALSPLVVLALLMASLVHVHYLSTLATSLLLSTAALILIYRNTEPEEQAWLRHLAVVYLHLHPDEKGSRRSLAFRIAAGVAMGVGGLVVLAGYVGNAAGHFSHAVLEPLGGALLIVAGIALVFGPWWIRLGRDLVTERQARIRAEERADMAAQVHDSVLQTLALIQRNADDPQRVAQLARSQERELRSWLFEGKAPGSAGESDPTTLGAGATKIAREVEAAHGVPVEVVTVGDCELDDDLRALLAAGREATVNAAKWSGAPTISVFAEVEPGSVSMFVRDRGAGFDPKKVAPDRRGVAESIRGRMARHGGTATIRSTPGAGTEVALQMPREAKPTKPVAANSGEANR